MSTVTKTLAVFAALVIAACGASEPQPANDAGAALVFGGSGRAGAMIVERLLAQGRPVTVFVRPTSDRSRLAGLNVDYAVGDALDANAVFSAVAQAKPDVIINTIGGRGNQQGFWDVTQMNMTRSAKQHGVREIIFLSSQGVGDSAAAYSPEALVRVKDSLDERFRAEEDLKASGLSYVIIRTGIIWPEVDAPATGKAVLTEDRTVLSPITRTDLANLVVDCIDNDACRNKTLAAMDASLNISR